MTVEVRWTRPGIVKAGDFRHYAETKEPRESTAGLGVTWRVHGAGEESVREA